MRIRTIVVIFAIGVGLVLGAVTEASVLGERWVGSQEAQGIKAAGGVFGVTTNKKVVALTFDDGPDPRWTPRVLALLQSRHMKATFFILGKSALRHPDLVKAEVAAGHEIGNHTFDHRDLRTATPLAVDQEIDRAEVAIEKAGAPRPTLFRPPKGLTDEVVGTTARQERFRTIFWDICVERYVDHTTVDEGVARILSGVHPGTIILAHDGGRADRTRTIVALPALLDGLRAKGYKTVTISDLLRFGPPDYSRVRFLPHL